LVRSKHEDGTEKFYEYATTSIVQDGLRLCVYSRPVTLLDVKVDFVRELIEQAEGRGVRIRLLLLGAFFATEWVNLLEGMDVDFIMPYVCNGRVQATVDSLEREGTLPFSIHDNSTGRRASFTMVVCWSERKGKLIPFATNVDVRDASRLIRMVPKEYRRRWGF
jgi:hypothetical protein